MLIEEATGNALDVRGASTDPDTPILALPKTGNSNQKWKYSTPLSSVSINEINFFQILESDILSTIKFHQSKPIHNLLEPCYLSEPNRLDRVVEQLNWPNKNFLWQDLNTAVNKGLWIDSEAKDFTEKSLH